MNVRRRFFLPLVAVCALLAASCAPNEQAQTVSFHLSIDSERLSQIEFVVSYADGKFAATDGQCVVSSAAGPRSFAISEALLLEKDKVRMMSRPEKRAHAARVRAAGAESPAANIGVRGVTSTTQTTLTTMAPTTTLFPPTTTTLAGNDTCGDGVRDQGEQCDDGDQTSGDGCDGNCQAEFAFSAIDDDEGELTIRITNGLGIAPGAALAFCKFQGDLATAELGISTLSCSRTNGAVCTPVSDAIVSLSTTTTTTTTTTSSTTTTTGDGDTTTTSTTNP